MKVGDLVWEGWGCNALVLKIVSTVHNPYISGNKKTK